jgi:hypothetical protein
MSGRAQTSRAWRLRLNTGLRAQPWGKELNFDGHCLVATVAGRALFRRIRILSIIWRSRFFWGGFR